MNNFQLNGRIRNEEMNMTLYSLWFNIMNNNNEENEIGRSINM